METETFRKVNSGTNEFPFYQIMNGDVEFCATNSSENADRILKLCKDIEDHSPIDTPFGPKGKPLRAEEIKSEYREALKVLDAEFSRTAQTLSYPQKIHVLIAMCELTSSGKDSREEIVKDFVDFLSDEGYDVPVHRSVIEKYLNHKR